VCLTVKRGLTANTKLDPLDRPTVHRLDVDYPRRRSVSTTLPRVRSMSNCFQDTLPTPALRRKTLRKSALYVGNDISAMFAYTNRRTVPFRGRILLPPLTILHQDVLPLLLPAHARGHSGLQNRGAHHHGLSLLPNGRHMDLLRPPMHPYPGLLPP
jgi:hypothetical protein